MKKPTFPRRLVTTLLGGLLLGGAAMTQGCLERPVVEQTPNTSNVFVENILNTAIDKIDLLFVIDNSVSMADKQVILERAVPEMVARLVTPDCVDDPQEPTVRQPNPGTGDCPEGLQIEFEPVADIHIGVISSSIGGSGSTQCPEVPQDDSGLLMPIVREGLPAADQTGFLAWTGGGAAERETLSDQVAQHVVAAGETGCGFEAPLEAWYRFLVDPSPPAEIQRDGSRAQSTGRSEQILQQREAFLRADSLVAIVVLTDENDCSAMQGGNYYDNAGFGWLVSETNENTFGGFPVTSPVCETNPNDECCFSCLETPYPDDCDASVCEGGGANAPDLSPEKDRFNARCYDNKRRFGIDLLYPVKRYVDGLSSTTIVDSQTGEEVPNPLLRSADSAEPPRDPGLVFFAGIVGVPWQDIATQDSLGDPNRLEYLNARELATPSVDVNGEQVDRWAVILGQPFLPASSKQCAGDNPPAECGRQPNPPLDPFMIESIDPREGVNPITGDATIPFTGTGRTINGHEYDNSIPNPSGADDLPAQDDLQYSCIFELAPIDAVKEDCTTETDACDCGTEPDKERPLCKPDASADSTPTNNQYWGKAYPATRVLQVLRDFGDNSIVASICPKILDDTQDDFGYNPAVAAIIDRLKEKLGGQCLPRELTIEDGEVPCTVVEALRRPADGSAGLSDCAALGRQTAGEEVTPAVRKQLLDGGFCSDEASCSQWDLCEIGALEGGDLANCFDTTQPAEALPVGYCYVDPAKGPSAGGMGDGCSEETPYNCTNELVNDCPASQRRKLRFAGAQVPYPDAVTFVACVGEASGADNPVRVLPGETPDPGTGMGGGN